MLSSVLNSRRAVEVNVKVMRAFVAFYSVLPDVSEIAKRIMGLEKKDKNQDKNIQTIYGMVGGHLEWHEQTGEEGVVSGK